MPASAVDVPRAGKDTPFEIRALQLTMLDVMAARYGFVPLPNELPQELEPESTESVLRRHLAHIRISGTVLDPEFRPSPALGESIKMDGVPLVVEVLDRYPPLLHCILCNGPKGEGYTICAGCWTTQTRFCQRMMLEILPDVDEAELALFKPLTRDQFTRAIRRAPRLEPTRRGYLHPQKEAARRKARAGTSLADQAARIDALGRAAAEPGITPRERRIRTRLHRAAIAAQPWNARDWFRGSALLSLDDAWLAELATADHDEEPPEDDGDDYPLEWLAEDWMDAPDHVELAETAGDPPVPHSNTAAGTAEHLEALHRNALFDAYRSARSRAYFEDGMDEYVAWLARQQIDRRDPETCGRARRRSPTTPIASAGTAGSTPSWADRPRCLPSPSIRSTPPSARAGDEGPPPAPTARLPRFSSPGWIRISLPAASAGRTSSGPRSRRRTTPGATRSS